MPSLDSLPGDQRAVLQLVLGRGRSYIEIARLLKIDAVKVRERALTALDALGPETDLARGHKARIADYLLGQLPQQDVAEVQDLLADSPSDRAWARVVSSELASLAAGPMPDIPSERSAPRPEEPTAAPPPDLQEPAAAGVPPTPEEPGTAAPPTPEEPATGRLRRPQAKPTTGVTPERPEPEPERLSRRERRRRDKQQKEAQPTGARRSSRVGGAFMILAGVVIVAAILFFVLRSGGSKTPTVASSSLSTTSSAPAASATTTSPPSTTSGSGSSTAAKVVSQINLSPPSGAKNSKAAGIAEVLNEGGTNGIAIVAQHVVPNTTKPPNAYAVWLYNSPGDSHILGFVNPGVGKTGRLSTAGGLPTNASHFKQLIVTLETTASPKTPGTIVLQGTLTGL
jgi:hypothetical protein